VTSTRALLPIDGVLEELRAKFSAHPMLILEAAPGAGKTTRVPPALLDLVKGEILVLEPRRLAARLSAERVAEELGERCGETVGFQIRFEKVSGPRTRIRYITEGLFLRLFLSDPTLAGVGCILLDEFHERHIHTDVALGLARYVQQHLRPDLKIGIMSATLDTGALGSAFPDAAVVSSEGRAYPVDIEYLQREPAHDVEILVEDAVKSLLTDPRCPGHILVFLAGGAEIRRAGAQIAALAKKAGADVLELRADLPFAEQRRVFEASVRRKIILATNVAETSVTIDGVTGVIDTGLAKVAGHAAWSGMPTLELRKTSQASANQRAGRAGRTAPGVALRLFTKHDYAVRASFEKPEIRRLDLAQITLEIKAAAARVQKDVRGAPALDIVSLPWLEAPEPAAVEAACDLLRLLGALDAQGLVTTTGVTMAGLPLHPRLSRLLVEAQKLGCTGPAAGCAALLSEGMIFRRNVDAPDDAHSDVHFQRDVFVAIAGRRSGVGHAGDTGSARHANLTDAASVKRVESLARQLASALRVSYDSVFAPVTEQALDACLLAGFPDRVAKVREGTRPGRAGDATVELTLCQGGQAFLSRASVARNTGLLLALEAEEGRGRGAQVGSSQVLIRVASAVDADLLLMSDSPLLAERDEVVWDADGERVKTLRRTYYGTLVLEEAWKPSPALEQEFLRKRVRADWPQPFGEDEVKALDYYKVRTALVREAGFSLDLPDFSQPEEFEFLLMHACDGKRSYGELREQ